ncbi:hypothetical protein RRG08_020161 [Elysia crispata]|uniref:Uncharacterized protein n=1 Tax=Elysia crispata TaxID=231223 RepID=A0AAE0YY53_9GAST|nr:hypothetical protein RRG08_020161 [Elysia crispata]
MKVSSVLATWTGRFRSASARKISLHAPGEIGQYDKVNGFTLCQLFLGNLPHKELTGQASSSPSPDGRSGLENTMTKISLMETVL